MNDIASESYDYEKYSIIMNIIWGNIEGEGRSWKNIFKVSFFQFTYSNFLTISSSPDIDLD